MRLADSLAARALPPMLANWLTVIVFCFMVRLSKSTTGQLSRRVRMSLELHPATASQQFYDRAQPSARTMPEQWLALAYDI